jgi:hypothetical protein
MARHVGLLRLLPVRWHPFKVYTYTYDREPSGYSAGLWPRSVLEALIWWETLTMASGSPTS